MTLASLFDVRLADGSEPPTDAAAVLLRAFDLFRAQTRREIGRRTLLGLLSDYLGLVASEVELDAAMAPLLSRGFIECIGPYKPRFLEPPFEGAKPMRLPDLGEPDDGEACYCATATGIVAARLCAGIAHPGAHTPWLLGRERVGDQVLIALARCNGSANLGSVILWCCNTEESVLAVTVTQLVCGGLVDATGDEDGRTKYRLSIGGQLRAKKLTEELGSIVSRLMMPASARDAPIPAPLLLQPDRKREVLFELAEDELCKGVLMPLLEAMGFRDVEYRNGPQERGKDIVGWKADEFGQESWLAVVAKACDITGAASGNNSCVTVTGQIRQSLHDPITAAPSARPVHMDRCWVMTSGRFVGDALSKVENELHNTGLVRSVRWVDSARLVHLIDHYCPSLWAALVTDPRRA